MAMEEKRLPGELGGHQTFLVARQRLTVSGVNGVERFDEDSIALSTENGRLLVQGEDLHIEKLSLDGGDLLVEGTVDSLTYEEEEPPRGGLLGQLFRDDGFYHRPGRRLGPVPGPGDGGWVCFMTCSAACASPCPGRGSRGPGSAVLAGPAAPYFFLRDRPGDGHIRLYMAPVPGGGGCGLFPPCGAPWPAAGWMGPPGVWGGSAGSSGHRSGKCSASSRLRL